MPIVNINTLQNNISNVDYMTTYTDVYLKQSLANLGQRFNVKGDGITSDSFTVSDVFSNYLGEIDSSNIVKVSYNYTDGNINMYLCSYNSANGSVQVMKNVGTTVPVDYIDNVVDIKENFQINGTNEINNINHYKAGALIIKAHDYYITSAVGCSNNIDDENEVIHEYVCDKISTVDNKLIEGLRIINANQYLPIQPETPSLLMIHIWNDLEAGYVVDVYKTNYSGNDNYNTLEYYVNDIINPICSNDVSKSQVSPTYIKNILVSGDVNSDNFYGWTLSKRFSENYINTPDVLCYPNSVSYNTEVNQFWKILDLYANIDITTNAGIKNKQELTQQLNINDIINYFAADTTTWFSAMKQKYNTLVYVSENTVDTNINLKKQIFGSLVKRLFTDWVNQESTVTENINVYNIYLPADYRIYYNCNDNDQSIIYNSNKNITVRFEPSITSKTYLITGDNHQQCILADTSETKVAVYNFTITYSENATEIIIDNIEWICEYILPYVNDNGYWCINDEPTDIFALGLDAGNPNIILAYSTENSHNITSGIEKDIMMSWNWEQNPIRIEPLDRDNNLSDSFYYDLNAYLPSREVINNLPPDQFALISNALIVNFLSPRTEFYPTTYNTSYMLDPSKIIYSDQTYDPSTAKYIRSDINRYNDDLATRYQDAKGSEHFKEIKSGEWFVTSESGDGALSANNASITYRNAWDIDHEGWQFSYKYTYKVASFQRNWLNNKPWNDPSGTYNDGTEYYYDTVWTEEHLTYSYYWPLLYKADYTYAYTGVSSINKDSLLYKLGDDAVITTFWSLTKNEEKNSYEWTYIKKPNSIFALDTNYINNLDNNIRYYLNHEYKPDNYGHRWVTFTPTNRPLKNNTTNENSYIYPVIKNKNRDEFISLFGEAKDENISSTSNEIYFNDLNFELAFYDNVAKNSTGDVSYISQSDNRYWKGTAYDFKSTYVVSDTEGNLSLASAIKSYTGVDSVIHYTQYPNEWVPNAKYDANSSTYTYQYPTLELKEVLLRDVNTVNRLNVLSFDPHGHNENSSYMMFNAYFGTSYETPNKNVLIIGTSSRNVNLGLDTFTTYESTYNLGEHQLLQLNIDNIELNGVTSINKPMVASKPSWNRIERQIPGTYDKVSIFSTIVQPVDTPYYMGVSVDGITTHYEFPYTDTTDCTVYTASINDGAAEYEYLSYNTYLLSYLNRVKHTQTRYFNSRYMGQTESVEQNSYMQTLSYLNVTQMLDQYCGLDIDDTTKIYGDSQVLWSIDTSDKHDDSNVVDEEASDYAKLHANTTYYMLLSTDLASNENLLFSYDVPASDTTYNTYRYVATNPIAVTYMNYAYAQPMEYHNTRYIYAFTYATSYTMKYKCDGCSLCSSDTCQFIQHCKWSYIAGEFTYGTCWAPIIRKGEDDYETVKDLYDELIKNYDASTYMLTRTTSKIGETIKYTYDVRNISYTCWTDDLNDPRLRQAPIDRGTIYFTDTNDTDANGNPIRIAYSDFIIDHLTYADRNYGISYATYVNGQYNQFNEPVLDANGATGIVVTICNSYYCPVPVSYYDPIRNLRDSYLLVQNPDDYTGTYLWINAPEDKLVKDANDNYQTLYYQDDTRSLTNVGTTKRNLLVAQYIPTIAPVNLNTTSNRGWDVTYKTNMYGERDHGSHYDVKYDLNNNSYLDDDDLTLYANRFNNNIAGYDKTGLEELTTYIESNTKETTYTCYFTYLGDFIEKTYTYFSYKCINVREIVTPHSTPYFMNGDLLSSNMTDGGLSRVSPDTIHWNHDKTIQ